MQTGWFLFQSVRKFWCFLPLSVYTIVYYTIYIYIDKLYITLSIIASDPINLFGLVCAIIF